MGSVGDSTLVLLSARHPRSLSHCRPPPREGGWAHQLMWAWPSRGSWGDAGDAGSPFPSRPCHCCRRPSHCPGLARHPAVVTVLRVT